MLEFSFPGVPLLASGFHRGVQGGLHIDWPRPDCGIVPVSQEWRLQIVDVSLICTGFP
jgi:hypothetical protein